MSAISGTTDHTTVSNSNGPADTGNVESGSKDASCDTESLESDEDLKKEKHLSESLALKRWMTFRQKPTGSNSSAEKQSMCTLSTARFVYHIFEGLTDFHSLLTRDRYPSTGVMASSVDTIQFEIRRHIARRHERKLKKLNALLHDGEQMVSETSRRASRVSFNLVDESEPNEQSYHARLKSIRQRLSSICCCLLRNKKRKRKQPAGILKHNTVTCCNQQTQTEEI